MVEWSERRGMGDILVFSWGSQLFSWPVGLTWHSSIFWRRNFTAQLQAITFNVKVEASVQALIPGVGAQFIPGLDSNKRGWIHIGASWGRAFSLKKDMSFQVPILPSWTNSVSQFGSEKWFVFLMAMCWHVWEKVLFRVFSLPPGNYATSNKPHFGSDWLQSLLSAMIK